MKKHLLSLLVLPALALTSCGKGGELKQEDAKERAKEISETSSKPQKNYEIKLSTVSTSGKDKKKSTLEYVLKANEDNEIYFTMKGESGGEKYDVSMYVAKNEEYEEVTYFKTYNSSKKEYESTAVVKKGNLLYSVTTEAYQVYTLVPSGMYAGYTDPVALMGDAEEEDNVKYYSTGEGNLTIEVKETQEADGEEETMVEASTSVTFDKGLLKSVSIKGKSSLGNTSSMTFTCSYPSSKVKVSLPSNWKDALSE